MTAWVAAAMLIVQLSLGIFGARRRMLRGTHIVLGVLLPLLTCAHAWLSMERVPMKSMNLAGLWLATAALLMLGAQVLFGMALIGSSENRDLTKRTHLMLGLGILALASVHVLLAGTP
ncbi:MAG TPA: hypothetical protein VGD62_13065 [Acidobacteriaceae bacterium]